MMNLPKMARSFCHEFPSLREMQNVDSGYRIFSGENSEKTAEEGAHYDHRRSLLGDGSTILCRGLNYWVDFKPPGNLFGSTRKTILNNINVAVGPGMNAIMGPSGSGKTTLLDILSGRIKKTGIEGVVLVNGQPMPKNFNRMTGYVIQEDVVFESLTVRENISFSANLRRRFRSPQEAEEMVNRVIEELGLTKCADTQIMGSDDERGVSGGERRRTSIAMELIISPSVLFLDEPTTGLDSSTALAVMSTLHNLSQKNTTVVFTVHQPRYSIFKMFDRLLLLSLGRLIYCGSPNESILFFKSLGYEIEEHDNPGDFFLDVINSDSSAVIHQKNGAKILRNDENEDIHEKKKYLADSIAESYLSSPWHQQTLREMEKMSSVADKKPIVAGNLLYEEYAVSFFCQFHLVLWRIFRDTIRRPDRIRLKVLLRVFWGLFLGSLYFQMPRTFPAGIDNRRGLMGYISLDIQFSSSNVVDVLLMERILFIHECASGYYRVSAYFLAKLLAELVTIHVVPILVFDLACYFMAGFRTENFLIFHLTLTLLSVSSTSLGVFIGASLSSLVNAQIVLNVINVMMALTGGVFRNLSETNLFFSVFQYISLPYYAIRSMYIIEFRDMTFYNTNGTEMPDVGNVFLRSQGISDSSNWEIWKGIIEMTGISLILNIAAYIQLRRIRKLK